VPERDSDLLVRVILRVRSRRHLAERSRVLAEVERDAVGAGTGPHDLTARGQRIEVLRPVAGHAPRQHFAFPERNGEWQGLQWDERLA